MLPDWVFYPNQSPPRLGEKFVVTRIEQDILDLKAGCRVVAVTLESLRIVRPTILCKCGCGKLIEQSNTGRTKLYFSATCRQRGRRNKMRAEK